MNPQRNITISVFIPIAFLVGIITDRFIQNFPIVQLDTKLNILQLASLLTTIVIAFLIPNFVTKIIQDNRDIKLCLIEEIKELIKILCKAKDTVSLAYEKKTFKPKNRDSIYYAFHEAELKAHSFQEQMKIGFIKNSKEVNKKVQELVFAYKDYLTGGELTISSFRKVSERFYRENNTEYSKLETGLKTIIQQIHKL